MGYDGSEPRSGPREGSAAAAVKFLIAGGFGVGKTTMVGAVSEVAPLRTEEYLTVASVGVDDMAGIGEKVTTTVAMDFGRITISPDLVLYLFGTPGQDRFWFMWDDLVLGAIGAVVIADTRRLPSSFGAIDFFENRGIPFVVAVNCFDGRRERSIAEVRDALDLDPRVPILMGDLRRRAVSRDVLLSLVDHLMAGYGQVAAERAIG